MSLSMAGLAVKLLKVKWQPSCSVLTCLLITCNNLIFFFLPLCPSGSWGSSEPQRCANDWGAAFTIFVWHPHQTGRQHDLPSFTASEGQHQLQGHISLLLEWTHNTKALLLFQDNSGYSLSYWSGFNIADLLTLWNWCLCSQCLCGPVSKDGGWQCSGSGCGWMGHWAEKLHQSGCQLPAARGEGHQGHTQHTTGLIGHYFFQVSVH